MGIGVGAASFLIFVVLLSRRLPQLRPTDSKKRLAALAYLIVGLYFFYRGAMLL